MIRTSTLQVIVEAELIDSKGELTGRIASILFGKAVSILTEPNEKSGKPAEIDGISNFVLENDDGSLTSVPPGDDPVVDKYQECRTSFKYG